jgi:hypothetical protein
LVTKPNDFLASEAVGSWAGLFYEDCTSVGSDNFRTTEAVKVTAMITLLTDGTGSGSILALAYNKEGANVQTCPVKYETMPPASYSTATWTTDGRAASIVFADPSFPKLGVCSNPTPDTLQCPYPVPEKPGVTLAATLERQR